MMRYILTLFLSASVVTAAQAQHAVVRNQSATHHQVLNALLQSQVAYCSPGARTTSGVSMERVVAQSTRDNTMASLNDSFNIKYGPGRGSAYDYNTMIYAYNYPYNTSPVFNYAGTFTTPQILFDTLRHWTVDPNTLLYGYYETDLANYDVLRNLVAFKALYVDSSFYPNMIYANSFPPGSHHISVGISSVWASGIVDSSFKQYYSYNSGGLLTEDSTYELHLGVWRIVSKTYYTYVGSNNLVQIDNYANLSDTSFLQPLPENLKYVNTYDGSHRLLTVEADYHYLAGVSPYVRDTFGYTGAYPFHTSWKEYQDDTINHYWAPMFNMSKMLNGAGLPDTVEIQGYDSLLSSWVPQTRYVMHYDAANNPDSLRDFEYNFTYWPATPNFTTRYYYETYLNTLGFDFSKTNVQEAVNIYPNPATTTVTISQPGASASGKRIISLINVSGQLVRREVIYGNGNITVFVGDLLPGVYVVEVQDEARGIIHRQSIVRN